LEKVIGEATNLSIREREKLIQYWEKRHKEMTLDMKEEGMKRKDMIM